MRASIATYVILAFLCVQDARAEGKLRVLVVCDAEMGESALEDARKWKWFFRQHFGRRGLLGSLDILTQNLSPDDVFNYYETLNVHPDNRLVFCYSGHGEWERDRGHFLRLPRGRLYRRDLLRLITAKQSRAQFVITDCCAMYCDAEGVRGLLEMNTYLPAIYESDIRVWDDLFFWHEGLVDLQSAKCGTPSFYSMNGVGSFFTHIFLERGACNYFAVDTNQDDFVTWKEFINHVEVRLRQLPITETLYLQDGEVKIRTHKLQPRLFRRGRPMFPTQRFVPYIGEEPIATRIAGGIFST